MSVEDDVALFGRVPTLNLLGLAALNVLAIGAEYRNLEFGDILFQAGDASDCGYVVRRGSLRIVGASGLGETIVSPGGLIGEMAMIAPMARAATATALESSTVIRLSRSLFQRVLESHPDAARRLRDDVVARNSHATSVLAQVRSKLT